jgi:hypothetical protein
LKKLDVSESQLSKAELAELQKTISKFFSTFCTKYSSSKVSRMISRLVPDRWCSGQLNLPETVVNRLTKNSFLLQEMNTELLNQEKISFSHNDLYTVMKNNVGCNFTDVPKQAQALKEHILRKLSLDEEDIFECKEELEENIRTFVANTCSNYKKGYRMYQRLIQVVAEDSKAECKQFQLPNSITKIVEERHSQTCKKKQNDRKVEHQNQELCTEEDYCQSIGASQQTSPEGSKKSTAFAEKQKIIRKESQPDENFEPSQLFQSKAQKIVTEKTTKPTTLDPIPIQRMPAVMKPFSEKSKRSQQYASAAVRQTHEPEAITLAASQLPTPLGRLIKRTNTVRGISVEKALNAVDNQMKSAETFLRKTPEEALGHILNNHLTKEQYLSMKTASALSSANIWPNYNKILKAKAQCRPDGIVINELNASVPIQNLLDHTTRRILLADAAVIEKMKELADKNKGNLEIQLYFKFGFDGCGSFNTNMQKDTTGKVPDASTLVTSQLVPLQAVVLGDEKLIIHNNPMPNNANACRPIRLSYEKESQDNIRTEASRLQAEVDNLTELVLMEEPKISVKYKGLFTMIDGKVLNELTHNCASSRCPICHQTSRQISNPDGDFTPVPGSLEFGASTLHFGIRSLEALLKIGYRQDIKKFGVKLTPEEASIAKARENQMKASFRDQLGLIVDQRRDGGAGNTTTGNVARIALAHPGNFYRHSYKQLFYCTMQYL